MRGSLCTSLLALALSGGSLLAAQDAAGFHDVSAALGLELGNAAAAWVDVDADGWVDLAAAGTLWFNEGGKAFRRGPTPGAGVFGDFDNDGFPDLFTYGDQRLFRNVEGKEFVELPGPELDPVSCAGAVWADFDGDGFLDLYVGGFENWNDQITYPDRVLMNRKGKGFEVTFTDARFRARGITACDFDGDADVDVYVSNYRLLPNILWRNDGKGGFTDVAGSHGALATSEGFDGGHSIGAAWGDFDGDGLFDLFAGNFAHVDSRGDQPKSRFLRNRGAEHDYAFEDRGTCGVFYQESYASPAAADYDNDGDLDLWFTTVYAVASFGRENFPVLYHNDGDWTFTDVTEAEGLAKQPATYQAAFADFDHDGDLDLVTGGRLFANRGRTGHWLEVRLDAAGAAFNRQAVGAQVRLVLGTRTLVRQVEMGTGEGNQNDSVLHFGLGDHGEPVALEVCWPDGTTLRVPAQPIDRLVTLQPARG